MNLGIYRYGEPRRDGRLLVGAARYLPRGVRRADYATRGYFDVWLPVLAPSPQLIAGLKAGELTFPKFARQYRAEMREPAPRQVIRLLAATAQRQPVSVGCYCQDPAHCHRSILQKLVQAAEADLAPAPAPAAKYSSPACALPEIED